MPPDAENSVAGSLAYALSLSDAARELIEQLAKEPFPPSTSDLYLLCVASAKTNAWLITAMTRMLMEQKAPQEAPVSL